MAAVRGGRSGARGDAGIGKTVLLEWAAGRAGDIQVARVAGLTRRWGWVRRVHQLLVPFGRAGV